MAKVTTEATAYIAPRGNKAMARGQGAVIAAQHRAAFTTSKAGVPIGDMPIRALASGFDLRFAGYTTPDATYSTRVTPTRYIGAVHTFAHRASIAKGSALACDALHNGASGPCKATAPNSCNDVRTYRCDDGDGHVAHARALDNGATLGEAAGIAFDALLRSAMAQGYNDVGRLLATAGIAQVLAHARYGAAMRAVFDAATSSKAPRKAATPRKRKAVANVPIEGTGAPTPDEGNTGE